MRGALHQHHTSNRGTHCSPWRSGTTQGALGACCPQRHSLSCLRLGRCSRVVPETFIFDWASKQTSSNPFRPQHAPQQHAQQQPQQAAAQSRHHVDFSAAQAAIDSTGSASDGSSFGASAKQLLQTAVHSLDMFEPRDTGSFEDESVESFEEAGMHSGTLATTHIVKANYEVGSEQRVFGGARNSCMLLFTCS